MDNEFQRTSASSSLEKLVSVSEEILQMSSREINFQVIADTFLALSGARFVAFNLYESDGLHFTTVATAGLEKHMDKVTSLLGFEVRGKRWAHDPERARKIGHDILTRFDDLSVLSGTIIPSFVLSRIHQLFSIGEIIVSKIMHGEHMLGDFTFAMPAGIHFADDMTAKIFTRQLGLLLAQREAALLLQQKGGELEHALEQQRVISKTALTLNTLDNFDDRIHACLKSIGEHIGVSRVYIFENSADGNSTSNTFEWCNTGIRAEIDNLQDIPYAEIPFWEHTLKRDGMLFASDIQSLEPDARAILESQGVKSVAVFALTVKGDFFGFVGFDECQKHRQWSDSALNMLGALSGIISHAIERRLMEDTIRAEIDRANNANRAKSEFLANMSHEIRTPMNAILGFSEALYHKISKPENKKMVASILSGGKLLLSLLNDILDLAKIEAGKLELMPQPVSMSVILEETKLLFSAKAHQKGLKFIVEESPDMPGAIEIDETRIKQIIFNLVSNAVKFTHRGHIKVTATFDGLTPERGTLHIRVDDTGIGIPAEKANTIFDDFSQLNPETTRQYEGTGLGLSICKRLTEKMQGNIRVESAAGAGSTFFVSVPDIPVSTSTSALQVRLAADESVRFDHARVLVIDDVMSDIDMIESLLISLGFDTSHAQRGEDALGMMASQVPDLILLDTRMPGMNGYALLQTLKSHAAYCHIPVIAYSATVPGFSSNPLSKLFNGSLLKPVSRKMLIEELMRHLPYKYNDIPQQKKETFSLTLFDEISDEVRAHIREINEELQNTHLPMWKQIKDQLVIFKIEDFGNRLLEMAVQYNFAALQQYAQKLVNEADNLDIESMRDTLHKFTYICDKIAFAETDRQQ